MKKKALQTGKGERMTSYEKIQWALGKCMVCGKPNAFQCWQWYNHEKKAKDKHENALFCSTTCLNKAQKYPLVKGRYHEHRSRITCMGEFE
jgi:hypothetical protein